MTNTLKVRLTDMINKDRFEVLTGTFGCCGECLSGAVITVQSSRFNRTGATIAQLLYWLTEQGHVVSTMVWDDMCTTEFVDGSLLLTDGNGGNMLAIDN